MNSDLKDSKKGIGFKYALKGILLVIKSERNFRIHLVFTLLVLLAGLFFHLNKLEWIIILLCIVIVLIAEMVNSAIELIIDHLFPDIHPVAGKVKDISAGSVLIGAIFSAIIGLLIFIPKIVEFLQEVGK